MLQTSGTKKYQHLPQEFICMYVGRHLTVLPGMARFVVTDSLVIISISGSCLMFFLSRVGVLTFSTYARQLTFANKFFRRIFLLLAFCLMIFNSRRK